MTDGKELGILKSFDFKYKKINHVEIAITDINDSRKEAVVTIKADEIKSEESKLLQDFAKHATVKGFRKGKVPVPVIRQKHAKDIQEELKRKLISEAYQKIVKDSEIDIYTIVDVKEGDVSTEADTEHKFTFDVVVPFEMPSYKGIEVEEEAIEVTAEQIEQDINALLEQQASYDEVKEAAAEGDYVRCDYIGTIDGQEIAEIVPDERMYGTQNGTWEKAGDADGVGVPAIINGVVGMSADEEKEVEETFADDFKVAELAGKTAKYKLKAIEVRRKKLPELNEDFFKAQSVENKEGLEEKVSEQIKTRLKAQQFDERRVKVLASLLEGLDFPLPQSAVETEIQNVAQNLMQNALRNGETEESLKEKADSFMDEARPKAENNVREQIVVSKIITAEKIELSNEEFGQFAMRFAYHNGQQDMEAFARYLKDNPEQSRQLQQMALNNKALDFIANEATVKEVSVTA